MRHDVDRAAGPDREHGADEQKERVHRRRRLALHVDMDAARDHKKRADQGNEAEILKRGVGEACAIF